MQPHGRLAQSLRERRSAQKPPRTGNTKKHFEQKITTRRSHNHKGRGFGKPEDWSGVLARSAKSIGAKRPALLLENRRPPVPQCRVERAEHRRPQRTRRPIRNWVSVTTPLCLRNGPRETRQKDAKWDERCGLGGPCHIARPDIGRGRDALLRDPAWHVQKTCNGNI